MVARNTQRLAGLKAKGAALSYWDRNAVVNKGLKYNKRGFVHEFFNHVGDTLFVQDHADDADQKQAVEEANEGMELVVDTMKKRKAETTDLLSRGGSAKSVKKADRKPPLDYSTPEEYKRGAWSPSVKPEKLRKDCKEIKDLADDELDAILKVIVR